jgi:ankyrin repeat protein
VRHIFLSVLLLIAIPLFAGRIHDAAYNKDFKTVKEIVKKAVNERDSLGRTPLHYAAWDKSYEIVNYLIKHKANVNALDSQGYTAIHKCFYWDSAMVVLLLKNGAKITLDSPQGESLLHRTAFLRMEVYSNPFRVTDEILEKLYASSNDVKAKNKRGQTPLHFAAYRGDLGVVKKLLAHGADINSPDEDNYTPLNYTKGDEWFVIAKGWMLCHSPVDMYGIEKEKIKRQILSSNRSATADFLKSQGATKIEDHKY